ncbi:hypothetical protein GCK32_022667 [Trichostrongylus colubriformis]|uniref:Uncharacterized protein n=1 Tax=Trichostrongylus colubriformis TaxID=6319 RepID=A0AAN8FFV8_TRICO
MQESEELLGETEMELRKDELLKNQYRQLLQQKNKPRDSRKSLGASEKLQSLLQEQVEEIKLLKTRTTSLEQQVSTDAKREGIKLNSQQVVDKTARKLRMTSTLPS